MNLNVKKAVIYTGQNCKVVEKVYEDDLTVCISPLKFSLPFSSQYRHLWTSQCCV